MLRKWTATVNVEPGFFSEVFKALKSLQQKKKETVIWSWMLCALKNKLYGIKNA